ADIYSARLRANAPTRPTNVAKDLLASNSSSRREASVVGSPSVSSGRRNASARGHTARSMSWSKLRKSGLSPIGKSMRSCGGGEIGCHQSPVKWQFHFSVYATGTKCLMEKREDRASKWQVSRVGEPNSPRRLLERHDPTRPQ